MKTTSARAHRRALFASALALWLTAGLLASVAQAQSVTCGNASNRGAKIQGSQVYDNVPDYVEASPGNFVRNVLAFEANPSSRPTPGTGVTYTWSQGVGTPGAFAPSSGMATDFTLPDVVKPAGAPPLWTGEVMTVVLTIHSTVAACPGTWTTSVTLNVLDIVIPAANLPPSAAAAATPSTADEGALVQLSAAGSYDPEGLALTHSWQQLSGTPVSLLGADTAQATFTAPNTAFPSGDTLVFRLAVSDGVYSDMQDVTVNVSWINDPPVAEIDCPLSVDERASFSLDGSDSTDSDDGIAFYEWTGGWPSLDLSGFTGDGLPLTAPTLGYQQAGNYTFRLTTRDVTGAYTFDECDVLVRDITPPQLDLPADIVAEADSAAGKVVSYSASAFDAVDGSLSGAAYFSCSPASGSTFALGVAPLKSATTTVACVAKDSAGNEMPGSFSVTVGDNTAPTFGVPDDFTLEATGASGAVASFAVPTADAVDGAGAADCTPASGATLPLGANSVLCTATDQRGNAAPAQTFTVTVADTIAPAIDVPDSFDVEATGASGATATFSATWTDVVDGSGDATCSPASGSLFALGATAVSCHHTDGQGNYAEAGFSITVVDTTPPTMSVPAPILHEATGPDGAPVSFSATTSDVVDGAGVATCDPPSGHTFPIVTTVVTCDASDAHGNAAAQRSFTVTVIDTTPPAMTLPDDFDVEATGPSGAIASFSATTLDIVDGAGMASCAPASGTTFALGPNLVTCNAMDTRGNAAATQTFTLTVVDTTPPTITVPVSFSREATGPGGATVAFSATTSDLVDGNGMATCAPASGSTFALGSTLVTCNAQDAHGNAAATRQFTVTVVDTTQPVLAGLVDVVVTAPGNSQATVAYTQPTATDLVDGSVPVTCAPTSGNAFPMGATTVNCSATDNAGNTATGSFKVTVTYAFNGFFQPIDNAVTNTAKAGSAIPVKFSLGGNQGLQIFAAGSPASAPMACNATAPSDEVELTVTAGNSTLQYDAGADQYIYVWKTDKSWLGCRQLRITLRDGSVRTAVFKFR